MRDTPIPIRGFRLCLKFTRSGLSHAHVPPLVIARAGIEPAAMNAEPWRCPHDLPAFGCKRIQSKVLLYFPQENGCVGSAAIYLEKSADCLIAVTPSPALDAGALI
jgi:hypothetical protein